MLCAHIPTNTNKIINLIGIPVKYKFGALDLTLGPRLFCGNIIFFADIHVMGERERIKKEGQIMRIMRVVLT